MLNHPQQKPKFIHFVFEGTMETSAQLRCQGDDCSFASFASPLSTAATHCSGVSPPAHPFPPASPPVAPPSSPPAPLPPPSPSPVAPTPAPPSSPPPDTEPSSLTPSVTDVGETTVTLEWSPPSENGGRPISSFRAWACDVDSGRCFGAEAAEWMRGLTLTALPPGRNYTVAVEALNAVGSSGNATVVPEGGASATGRGRAARAAVFTTLSVPAAGLPAALAAPLSAFDNETSLHLVWWAPFDNGAALTRHELLIARAGADAADAGLDVATALASAGAAQVACATAATECGADDGSVASCWLDAACWAGSEHSVDCGAAGHPLCRWCDGLEQQACPTAGARHALGDDAAALVGGALRVRVSHAAAPLGGWQQFLLLRLARGTTHQVAVRARNALGWGAFSAPARLRTAGEPPPPPSLLELDAASALSAEDDDDAAVVDPALVAGLAVGLLLCCGAACAARRCVRAWAVRDRDELARKEEIEIADAAAAADDDDDDDADAHLGDGDDGRRSRRAAMAPRERLDALLRDPLSSTPLPAIEEAAGAPGVNQVLVYLSNQERKRQKEREQRARAEEAERKRREKQEALGAAKAAAATATQAAGPAAVASGGRRVDGASSSSRKKVVFKPGRTVGNLNLSCEAKAKGDDAGAGGEVGDYLEARGLVVKPPKLGKLSAHDKAATARAAAILGHRAERVAHRPPESLDPVLLPPYRGATKVAQQVRLAMAGDPLDDGAADGVANGVAANVNEGGGAAVASSQEASAGVAGAAAAEESTLRCPAEMLGAEASASVAAVGQPPDAWPDLVP